MEQRRERRLNDFLGGTMALAAMRGAMMMAVGDGPALFTGGTLGVGGGPIISPSPGVITPSACAFTDDFNDASVDANWTQAIGSWSEGPGLESGIISSTGVAEGNVRALLLYEPCVLEDARMSARVIGTLNGWGLAVRAGINGSGQMTGYSLRLNNTQLRLQRVIDDAITVLATFDHSILSGDRVDLIADGATLIARHNGADVLSVGMGTPAIVTGRVGLYAELAVTRSWDDAILHEYAGV